MPVVIEVIARLGETRLDHDYITPGSVYQLGTTKLVAKPGTHRVGLVEITMDRTFRVETPVGLPRFGWRPLWFVVGSLALHLVIWTLAMLSTPIEKLIVPVDKKPHFVIRIDDHRDPPPKMQQIVAARTAATAVTAQAAPKRRSNREDGPPPTEADMYTSAADAVARVARSSPDVAKAMEGLGPHYDEDGENAKAFGGHTWDIDSDPAFDTIKTGPGYDLSDIAFSGSWDLGMTKEEKALMKIKGQTALAHKSAIRGDCVPAHRIAKWLHKLDETLYKQIYLADPEVAYCLTQPVPPSYIKAEGYQRQH